MVFPDNSSCIPDGNTAQPVSLDEITGNLHVGARTYGQTCFTVADQEITTKAAVGGVAEHEAEAVMMKSIAGYGWKTFPDLEAKINVSCKGIVSNSQVSPQKISPENIIHKHVVNKNNLRISGLNRTCILVKCISAKFYG